MKKRILVVDDHPIILEFMVELLTGEGHEVMAAEDGLRALDLLQTHTPDVVFIDLIMPNVDGGKLCQIIRRIRGFEKVYLVILSGITAEDGLDFAALGANACITKGDFEEMSINVRLALAQSDQVSNGAASFPILGNKGAGSAGTATRELLRTKQHMEVILERLSDGLIEVSRTGRIVFANATAKALIGIPEERLLGMMFVDLFVDSERREIQDRLSTLSENESLLPEELLVGLQGRHISLKLVAIFDEYSQTIAILRDLSERKRIEAQLQQAQKMEAIGVLAGGIAHDFNNILTAILGNITLAKMYSEPGNKVSERLDEAEKASLRAKDLTQHLLTFARGGAPVKKTVCVEDIVADACNFALRGSNVRCEISVPQQLWSVEIDVGQISQVIHNLVINADQAMPDGGIIKVRAENIIVGEQDSRLLAPGKYVSIAVQDHGLGIPENHLSKIFDPYFTTKQIGSGLGLATVYSIIRNHRAVITVESEVGRGTTFHIYLPASAKEMRAHKPPELKLGSGKGRILVMDDEEMVRKIVGQMLSLLGYDADYANDGEEAMASYREKMDEGKPYDAVIMDLTIPGGMGGKEAIRKLIEMDPRVKGIVSSGYSNDPIMAEYEEHGFKGVIVKPYQVRELSEVLEKALSCPFPTDPAPGLPQSPERW